MANTPGIIFFEAITPVHMGAGSSLSHIDLPIQRNQVTNLPIFQSSGVKGALRAWTREACNRDEDCLKKLNLIFGPEPGGDDSQEDRAGLLGITDAELLLFPVASEPGVFSFVTCPYLVGLFNTKMSEADLLSTDFDFLQKDYSISDGQILVNRLYEGTGHTHWLLDMPLRISAAHEDDMSRLSSLISFLAFNGNGFMRGHLEKNLVMVSNEMFRDLTTQATEVRNRIRINPDTGIVQEGALWTEELLPLHSLLYSLTFFSGRTSSLSPSDGYSFIKSTALSGNICQLGGDQSLGHGVVRTLMYGDVIELDQELFKLPEKKAILQHQAAPKNEKQEKQSTGIKVISKPGGGK